MRLEAASEIITVNKASPSRAAMSEVLGDYLPLPISQQYPKRGTHKLAAKRPAEGGLGAARGRLNKGQKKMSAY